jgi:hypothetical protein
MTSNQNFVHQFLTGQIKTVIKSIHTEPWSSLHTLSTTLYFKNMPIEMKSIVIKQQQPQRQENIYQKYYHFSCRYNLIYHFTNNTIPNHVQ